MSALEAQMSKCVCIATDFAALTETIGDRGILIKEPIYSNEYKEKSIKYNDLATYLEHQRNLKYLKYIKDYSELFVLLTGPILGIRSLLVKL